MTNNFETKAKETETALDFRFFHIVFRFKLFIDLIFPFITGKAQALANFFVEKQRAKEQNRTGSQNQQEKAPLVPYRFLTHGSQGLEIDLRLCNRDIIGSAKPHLLHILNTAMQVIFLFIILLTKFYPLLTTYPVMPEGEIFLGGPVVIGGDNLPYPGWNRVN